MNKWLARIQAKKDIPCSNNVDIPDGSTTMSTMSPHTERVYKKKIYLRSNKKNHTTQSHCTAN